MCCIPLVGVVAFVVKIIIDHIKQQKFIDNFHADFIKLNCNGFVTNQIDLLHPPNRGSSVMQYKEQKHKPHKLTNCKNCGAVLHGNKCEFCDTEYDW